MSPLLRLCNKCGRTYPDVGRSTGKCPDCQRTYERDKTRRRRTTSTATTIRDSAAWKTHATSPVPETEAAPNATKATATATSPSTTAFRIEHGGHALALDNLETLCRRHHEEAEAAFLRGRASTQIAVSRERNSGLLDSSAEDSEGPSIG